MHRDLWLGIELRHFAALQAISEERSFRGAANRLGYVQSAISRQVAYLEQMTGERLIERSRGFRPVHLTDAGELLLEHAADVLASITAAKSDFARLRDGRRDEVTLGVFSGVPTRILPPTLTAFAARSPDVRVAVIEAPSDESFFGLIRDGTVDLAFTCLPVEDGPFEHCELLRVPWVLVTRADAELARQVAAPTAADLSRLALIGANTARIGRSVEERLIGEAGEPRVVFRSDVAETAQALAAAGVGAAIMPRLAADEHDPRTAVIDLGDLFPPLSIGLTWHRNRRLAPAVASFRDLTREVCGGEAQRRFGRASVPITATLRAEQK
jgi:DNA-binding transcriptional LysR family regulator